MAEFHDRRSFLKNTRVTDFYLDVNTLPRIPKRLGDKAYVIEARYENRPDLLAYELYGSARLWWVFALRNPDVILDPINDFASGISIFLPSKETVNTITG